VATGQSCRIACVNQDRTSAGVCAFPMYTCISTCVQLRLSSTFFGPYPTVKAVPAADISECRKVQPMSIPATMQDYLRFSKELGKRIVEMYPALHTPDDPVRPG